MPLGVCMPCTAGWFALQRRAIVHSSSGDSCVTYPPKSPGPPSPLPKSATHPGPQKLGAEGLALLAIRGPHSELGTEGAPKITAKTACPPSAEAQRVWPLAPVSCVTSGKSSNLSDLHLPTYMVM